MTLGPIVDGLRVVRSGLEAGESVVINGLQRVRPGVQVTPVVEAMDQLIMKFSKFFVDRPIFAAVLSLVIVVAGALALFRLPISEYPQVVPPTVVVRATYPGANPKVIAETVASPLEQQINGVEDMLYMFSQATSDGRMKLTVTFALGTDLDNAQVQVQNRVAQALPRLPSEVQRIGVVTEKSTPDFIMVVHLVSPDGRYDQLYLSNFATLRVKDELARIPGVGSAQVFGAGEYSMRVWLDPDRLASRRLTTSDVIRAIREQNVQVAAGVLGAQPAPVRHDVPALGQHPRPADHRRRVRRHRRPRDTGRTDHARARRRTRRARRQPVRAAKPARQPAGGRHRHLPAAGDQRHRGVEPGAPDHGHAEAVVSRGRGLQDRLRPHGLRPQLDPAVVETLFEAILLVVIVVMVFLQTWRASIIPLVAVPVSLIGTFAVMLAMGFSLNTLSLFGLVLSIGIVVDDAIVVVENVERHIELRVAAARSDETGDGGSVGSDHRDRAGALRGVRSDRVRQRPDRTVLSAVRADDRDLDGHLRVQLADAQPGAGLAAAQAARSAA